MARTMNFNAGPAALPLAALERAKQELTDFAGSGMSVMEHSHRGKEYEKVHDEAAALLPRRGGPRGRVGDGRRGGPPAAPLRDAGGPRADRRGPRSGRGEAGRRGARLTRRPLPFRLTASPRGR